MNRFEPHERQRTLRFEQTDSERAARLVNVVFQGAAESCFFFGSCGAAGVWTVHEFAVVTAGGEQIFQGVDQATRHAGAEVHACGTKNDDHSGRHVFTRVVADSLNNCKSAAIADGEAFAGAPTDVKFT